MLVDDPFESRSVVDGLDLLHMTLVSSCAVVSVKCSLMHSKNDSLLQADNVRAIQTVLSSPRSRRLKEEFSDSSIQPQ